ncbi:uncharacterized protein LOC143025933 [Oratosquilla oratoria]|uniref:uncharacterized protein LOC143025933 n=1 Tax=Oratosquilla oratoria TaxID=337810 RepID=UPI003F76B277
MQKVVVDETQSNSSFVISGVPQGSVLGPLLFLVTISDIDQGVRSSKMSSFADDTRISREITTREDSERLQKDLEAVYKWSSENNMVFNNKKFELIRYGANENLKEYRYTTSDYRKFLSLLDLHMKREE